MKQNIFQDIEAVQKTMNVFEEVSRKFVSDFQRFTWVQASFKISITFNLSFEFCKNLKDNLLSVSGERFAVVRNSSVRRIL